LLLEERMGKTTTSLNIDKKAKLHNIIEQKQHLIDQLLEITEAINQNQSASQLFEIYSSFLHKQFNFSRIKFLFCHDDKWLVYDKNQYIPYVSNQVLNIIKEHKEIAFLDNELEDNFDIVIPVVHKEKPLAFVLVDGIFNKVNNNFEEEFRFLQAFTNVTVIAMENTGEIFSM